MILNNCIAASVLCCAIFTTAAYADNCDNAANDTEVHACLQKNKDDAEKALNNEYSSAKDRIHSGFRDSQAATNENLDLLLKAQRGWLTLRENQCQLEAYGADKNSNPYVDSINDCIARMDKERTQVLKQVPYAGLSEKLSTN